MHMGFVRHMPLTHPPFDTINILTHFTTRHKSESTEDILTEDIISTIINHN